MAESDAKREMDAWIKKNGQGNASSHRPKPTKNVSQRSKNVSKENDKTSEIQAENVKLRSQLRKLTDEKNQSRQKREAARKEKEAAADDKAIRDVEHGSDKHPTFRRRFDKTYHLHYINPKTGKKQPYSLHFVIRSSTMFDQPAINNEVTVLTNRLGKFYEVNDFGLVKAFATIKVLGIKIPKAFTDPAKLHRLDLLAMVYYDFTEWEAKFRQYSMV